MCGIAALFSHGKPVSTQALKQATGALHHRGPDSHGAWFSSDNHVGLGHTRLSIIDLTTGDQPIASEDGRVHIIVNGESYDFERHRRELEQRGHQFRTRSDSEIALHLYEEFGTHCVQQLRGEFAFVVWDDRNQMLFAVRDRFGIKPPYKKKVVKLLDRVPQMSPADRISWDLILMSVLSACIIHKRFQLGATAREEDVPFKISAGQPLWRRELWLIRGTA